MLEYFLVFFCNGIDVILKNYIYVISGEHQKNTMRYFSIPKKRVVICLRGINFDREDCAIILFSVGDDVSNLWCQNHHFDLVVRLDVRFLK
jgi:hypothetical protein